MPRSPAPAPRPAWLVRAGSDEVLRGTLSLDATDLLLRAEGAELARVRLAGVSKVRRTRGSPVLVLETLRGTVLLYFAAPPAGSGRTARPRGWDRLTGDRGLERTVGLLKLRQAGKALGPVVREWEEAIRAQAGSTATNLRPREE